MCESEIMHYFMLVRYYLVVTWYNASSFFNRVCFTPNMEELYCKQFCNIGFRQKYM
jgi:hypothetical protein